MRTGHFLSDRFGDAFRASRAGGECKAGDGGEPAEEAAPGETAFDALTRAAARVYAPSLVVAGGRGDAVRGLPLLDGREAPAGHALAFVCERYACELPISEPDALAERLARGRTT